MKKKLLIILLVGVISYQCAETKKNDENISINVPDQFLFVGKNKPMMTVIGTKTLPTLTITDQGTTDAKIIGSDSIQISQEGTINVQFTIGTIHVKKEFKVVKPNYVPIKMSITVPKQPVTGNPQMVKLGYTYNYTAKELSPIHQATDTVGYKKALELFPSIITSSILYIDTTTLKYTERVTLFGADLLKVGTYVREEITQTDSIKYTFTYQETGTEDETQTIIYKQHKNTNEITAIVRRATLIYKKQG